MPSPERLTRLWGKDARELLASRAFLLFVLIMGPLVGHAFVTAVETYAEASGSGGGPAALAQGLSPLDGLVVPTFGAYALGLTLLFPFVAIRLVSAEKQSGALKLLFQTPASLTAMVGVKLLALLAAWVVAWLPGCVGLALWRSYGGHLSPPEVSGVLLGHLLRALLTSGVAIAAAAVTDSAATAAVAALAFTLGTWALDFVAQVHGGLAQTLAAFTPEAALHTFETGEVRLAVVLVTLAASAGATALAVVWLSPGRSRIWRAAWTTGTVALAAAAMVLGGLSRASWDLSEDQRNSLPPADARALAHLPGTLAVTVNLAPEDPRLADLERGVLKKLGRSVPRMRVRYAARTAAGLFERPGEHYGEVWYQLNGRRAMSRSTTEPIVLETIYQLAGLSPPPPDTLASYPGYPLAARPAGAPLFFYLLWPIAIAAIWLVLRHPPRPGRL